MLADLHTDLAQARAVVRAHALVLGQFVAPHVARQRRIQRLAAAFGALVRRHVDLLALGLGGRRLGPCAFDLGLVEEHVLLVRSADLAGLLGFGVEELALEAVELLLEQVALGAHDAQFTGQRLALPVRIGQRLLQGGELFGGGHANHRRAFSRGETRRSRRAVVPGVMRSCVETRRSGANAR